MLPRGVSTRLAVIFGALFVLTLGPLVVLVLVVAGGWHTTALDDHLRDIADEVGERIEDPGSDPQFVVDQLSSPSQLIEIRDTDGQTTARSTRLGNQYLPVSTPLLASEGSVARTASFEGGRLRVISLAVPAGADPQGYVIVGAPMPDLGPQTRELLVLLGLVGGGALALSLLATSLISRWLTRPIRELSASIGTSDVETADEIAHDERTTEEVRAVAGAIQRLSARHRARLDQERAFFADSSHVLRTPLAVLQGNLDLLEHAQDEAERREALEQARSAIRSMTRTVSGLLLLSRTEAAPLAQEIVDLSSLVERAAAEFGRAWPDHTIHCEVADRLAVVGDEHALREAVDAITENAVRYTPEPGTIRLRCRRERDRAVVEVIDEGIGLSEEEARRARERFFRGPRAREIAPVGTGLGLAVVQRIMELHDGAFALEPRADRSGAIARLDLPLFE